MGWFELLELTFVALLVAGVAFVYWPAALILAGVLGVVACERRSALTKDAARSAEMKTRLEQVKAESDRVAARSAGIGRPA
jgi:hypothetical protein